MSSYLNIYGITKKSKERVLLLSYSRNNEIYQEINDELNIPWNGNGEENYRQLSSSDIDAVINDLKERIDKSNNRLIEYEKHANGNTEIIDEIINLKEYIEEMKITMYKLYFLSDMINDTVYEWSGFENYECCID